MGEARNPDRAERSDRRWFERNAPAMVRLRDTFADERDGGSEPMAYAIVFREADGTLRRRFFNARRRPAEDAASLLALWIYIDTHVPQGLGRTVALSDEEHRDLAAFRECNAAEMAARRIGGAASWPN